MSSIISTLDLQNTGAYLFPSSSTDGKGKLLTESNMRDITEKIQTRNFKELKTDFQLGINNGFTISNGVAIINGYKIYIPETIRPGVPDVAGTFDVSIKIATQTSTDGWIADSSNNGGVVYIEYTENDGTEKKTLRDVIGDDISNTRYKPAVNRFNTKNSNNTAIAEYFSDNYEYENLPVIDDADKRFSSSVWVIDRLNGLFVVNTETASVKDIDFNALYGSNRNSPTLRLTIGNITMSDDGNGNIIVSAYETYNCTQRIDVDDIFVGNETFSEYLATVGGFVKSYGSNNVTSIRNSAGDYTVQGTGEMVQVPYISIYDSLFYKYNSGSGNVYDTDYMYIPYTYMGETYNEKYFDNYDTTATYNTGDIVLYNNGYYECIDNEVTGDWDSSKWKSVDKPPIVGDDVNDLYSIIECSYNSIPTTAPSFSGNTVPYGSQILSVASYNDCYTRYSYNILHRLYNGTDIDTKQCSFNEYRIGMYNPSDYLKIAGENDYSSIPPFGLYGIGEKSASVLIKTYYDEQGTTTFDTLELKTSTSGIIRLTANITEQTTEGINEYSSSETYEDVGTRVLRNGVVWINTEPITTAEEFDINKWDIAYVNSGNTFDIDYESAIFNIYSGNVVSSYAGFKNVNNNAVLEFSNGTHKSSVKLNGTDTYNTETPVLEFSDNVKVAGYVRANRVYNAVYNDYAEWYNSNNAGKVYEGDIIYYIPETDSYENYSDNPATVIGVCSEKYGMIVGGKDIPNMQENRKDFIPVSLCGRVKIRLCTNQHFNCGDYVYADGGAVGMKNGDYKIGKFLKYIDENYGIMQVFLA